MHSGHQISHTRGIRLATDASTMPCASSARGRTASPFKHLGAGIDDEERSSWAAQYRVSATPQASPATCRCRGRACGGLPTVTIGLDVVVASCALANLAGLVAAALMVCGRRAAPIGPRLLSFVVGVLLGAVLLDLLPHLWEATGDLATVLGMFVAAIAVSGLFDRACLCRHGTAQSRRSAIGHHHAGSVFPSAGRANLLLVGDFVHSLVDGALIVAAFAVGVVPGAVATMAVAIHEVPRRVATVTLLVRAGCRPAPALGLAACAGLGAVLGAVLTWWSAEAVRPALPLALAMSAAAMFYVAIAQSAQLLTAWRARMLTLECGLPFVAGILIMGGSHHVIEWLG